jgi:hypothetical protein
MILFSIKSVKTEVNNKSLIYKVLISFLVFWLHVNFINAQHTPLFDSDEPLKLTLIADVVALTEDKSEEPEYSTAVLMHYFDKLKFDAFEIKVKARGSTRRLSNLCEFPPLKINFKKNNVENTIFENQDKLKFVSQCKLNEEFENYVLEEYLLYKTYSILTEESYKVRMVNITIRDNELRVPDIEMTGFLIEDDKLLAKRIGAKSYDKVVYSQDSCTDNSMDRLAMFQYMIGNTDWYVNTGHNTDVFKYKSDGALFPVPYDFDFSGVINTIYAKPSKEIPIKQVRQRYYKGSCRDINGYNSTIKLFNEKQEEIYSLYNSFNKLPREVIKGSLRYYDKFYKIINDTELVTDSLNSSCYVGPFKARLK